MNTNYQQFEVVVVPFPFTDRAVTKRRPALIVSDANVFNTAIGHSGMAMITTATHAPWPLDVPIQDLATTGLRVPSIIRMKLFTLDHALILKKIGQLSWRDRATAQESLQQLFNF